MAGRDKAATGTLQIQALAEWRLDGERGKLSPLIMLPMFPWLLKDGASACWSKEDGSVHMNSTPTLATLWSCGFFCKRLLIIILCSAID